MRFILAGEGNDTFLISVWKPFLPDAVGLSGYKWYQSLITGGVRARMLARKRGGFVRSILVEEGNDTFSINMWKLIL